MNERTDIFIAPVLPRRGRASDRPPRGRRPSMEIVRHNWQVGPDHDVIECAEEGTGHRIGHACAGCHARLSLDYLEFTFAGTSDVLADADVMAASIAAARS